VKNLVNWQYLLFTETWRHSKLASRFCKIRLEKHPRAFVKVVEGSEIYNFPIHHFVHFYSIFLEIFVLEQEYCEILSSRPTPRRACLAVRVARAS
jgi:uncharacterized membrane protein YoaT (DUF817 family)